MHFSKVTFLAIFAASASAYSATGRTFAVNHFYGKGPLVEGRMDPIISPGVASGHVHAVQGGNNFALSMTDDQALASTCTSSLVKNDKSNYWTPSLYFHAANGSFISVPMFYMNVYYFFEATTDKIEAFQPGHRMVIGNPSLRSPPATGGKSILDLSDGTPQPVQWTCPRQNTNNPLYPTNSDGLHGVGIQDPGNGGAGVGFPDQNCDGYASPLRADIHFPSCYDPSQGLDAYKTNMQFPTNGNCPSGWIHTPHLFYEVYWNTPLFANEWTENQGTQPFVLSNGDPTGYGLHADFISGWDVATLQQIIDNCDAGDSGMDKCPGLMGGLNDPSTSCNIQCPIDEVISGDLTALPGINPLGAWGVAAAGSGTTPTTPTTGTTSAKAVAPVSTTAPESSAAAGGSGGGSTPASSAAAGGSETSPAEGSTSPAGVVQTVSVLPVEATSSTAAAGGDSTTAPEPTSAPAVGGGSGSNTLVTSYVSETTVVWTTVTASGPAPSASSSSGSDVGPGWSYKGCFTDKLGNGNRVLSGITFANIGNHAVTNTKCTAYCDGEGYSMAGTEYGGQCFCGNEMNGTSTMDESTCDMACEGDGTQTCGGSLTLSVYSKSGSARRWHSRHVHQHLNRNSK